MLPNHPTTEQRVAFEKWMDEDSQIKCYVLASMTNELQSQYEYMPTARAISLTYKSCIVSRAVQCASKCPEDSSI